MIRVGIYSPNPIFRAGISHFLFWEKYGFTVVGTAGDRKQWEALYRLHRPDLCFYSGDSCKEDYSPSVLLSSSPETEIVLIGDSNGDLFGKDPVFLDHLDSSGLSPDKLIRKLSLYQADLEARKRERGEAADSVSTAILAAARSQALKDLLFGKIQSAGRFGIVFPHPAFALMLYRFGGIPRNEERFFPEDFSGELLETGGLVLSCRTAVNEYAFLYNFRRDEVLHRRLQAMGNRIRSLMERFFNCDSPLIISRMATGEAQFCELYRECQAQIPSVESGAVDLYFTDQSRPEYSVSEIDFQNLLRRGEVFMESRDYGGMRKVLADAIQLLSREGFADRYRLRFFCSSICYQLRCLFPERGKEGAYERESRELLQLDRIVTRNDGLRFLQETEERFLGNLEASKTQNPYLFRVLEYIHQHYRENPGLTETASAAGISPGYLSTLFREKTGRTFKDYCIDYRLDRAKKLLRSTVLPIARISERIGYDNERYFSKIFRKRIGCSPSQYRKGTVPVVDQSSP